MIEPSAAHATPPVIDSSVLEGLMAWRGRTESIEETIAPLSSAALAALLDRDLSPRLGDPIAPLVHWLHFLPIHRQSEIAGDGHVRRGGFMPPIPLPRRMFAGASVAFLQPLRIGERARRVGTVTDIKLKQGRTGPLVFVTVLQEIFGEHGLALREEQNIVYRSAPTGSVPAPVAETATPGDWMSEFVPDNAALFRYSALLFNAHRIHYDHPYTTGVEAYPGLVVHGQLVATLLADLAARNAGRELASFSFQSRSAFFADAPILAKGLHHSDRAELWAEDATGAVGMRAQAGFR